MVSADIQDLVDLQRGGGYNVDQERFLVFNSNTDM